nr:hypothetical protein HK105_007115 [Polyrhizophydium stewartii]
MTAKTDESVVLAGTQATARPVRFSRNPLSFTFISWITPLMVLGAKRPLVEEDLPRFEGDDTAASSAKIMDRFWAGLEAHRRNPASAKPPSLFAAIAPSMALPVIGLVLLRALTVTVELLQPFVIQQILQFLVPSPDGPRLIVDNGLALAFILFGTEVVAAIANALMQVLALFAQARLRAALVGAAYRKSMRLSTRTQSTFSSGKINSFIVSDVDAICRFVEFINEFWSTPTMVVIAIVFLINFLGQIAWVSIGTIIFFGISQSFISGPIGKYSKNNAQFMDERTKTLREFLYGIKIVKFQATEDSFASKIFSIYAKQIKNLRRLYGIVTILFIVGFGQGAVAEGVTFAAYSAIGGRMRPEIIFPALALLGSVNSAALKMSAASFTWEEVKKDDDKPKPKSKRRIFKQKKSKESAQTKTDQGKKDGDAESDKPAPFALQDITLDIPRGSLVAVVGSVGSGKSSFLSALIGGMRKTAGDSALFGSVAYCAQEPWILTGTIEENIVFGNDAVRDRIPAAIAAACLDRDLEILPNGLGTQIGEKGINLSGGQKARVALARAIARDADIYLLDDPIAALDAHVGKKVFEDAICGVLRGKTVFLVTHQLHLLPKVDMVVVLDEGRVVETGIFRELMAREDGALAEIMKDYHFDDHDPEAAKDADEDGEGEDDKPENLLKAVKAFEEEKAVAEDRRTGAIKISDYMSFFTSGGAWFLPTTVALFVLLVGANAMTQIVLAVWSSPGDSAWGLDKSKFVGLYIGIALSVAVFHSSPSSALICVTMFHGAITSAISFHRRALNALVRAPMGFYENQPVGRILNRMTTDVRQIEGFISQGLINYFNILAGMMTAVVVIAFSSPYLLIEFGVIFVLVVLAFPLYQATYRELKRLTSILVSPLTAHISESLNGISTIKAYGAQELFVAAQEAKMDASNVGGLVMECAEAWVALRLQLITSTATLLVVLLASLGAVSKTTIGASLVAAVTVASQLQGSLRITSHVSAYFNSVERLNHYAKELPAEAARELPTDPKDGEWPIAGAVTIRDLEIRYPSRPDHAVIQDLSLDIQPGEKVGVVGRTGSGKSTLMTALFRIMEASKGSIAIDGIDIASLGLKTLRSRLQIIPQDPVLFKGTVRSNLDFAGKYTDDELWAALDLVGLKDFVGSLDGKLDAAVEENGANLSMGQRQLMCLCKAILAKPKVLIMDEATASVDAEADRRIQESIETQFAATTVLSIAHRLNTIAAFDRVLVLDGGRIAEFDAPHVLLGRAGSVFGDMVEATGAANAAVIRQIAADHYAKTH